MTEVLHTPSKERVVTTNAWAFLHWLRMVQQVQVTDWGELQRWSASDPNAFAATIARFAGLSASPLRLARHERRDKGLIGGSPDGVLHEQIREFVSPLGERPQD